MRNKHNSLTPLEKTVRGRNSLTGFTLLELLLVITIISILLGVSFPRLRRTAKNTYFTSFVNKTYLFLDYVKTQATVRDDILEVRIDLEEDAISLMDRENEAIEEIKIPENIQLESEKDRIAFYPDGTQQEFNIIITDNEGRQSMVSSKGFDGKIKVGIADEI